MTIERPASEQRGQAWVARLLTPVSALLCLRILLLVMLPYDAVVGYGDYRHFFELARLAIDGEGGMPWLGHWVEFPPLFPYVSLALYRLAGGVEHIYGYMLAVLMALFDAANLWLFGRLARRVLSSQVAATASWVYLAFLALPAFGWWTFEPLAVFWMLLTLVQVLEGRPMAAGITAGFGFLTKIVPVLALVPVWRFRPGRQAIVSTLLAVLVAAVGLAPFLVLQPRMALASLQSQTAKGSWETVWALIDGNQGTGSFGPVDERLDASAALRPRGNPARVPHWLPTLAFGAIGMACLLRAPRGQGRAVPGLLALLLVLMFLWARGWSPQWLAYLIPLLLLSLPLRAALGVGLTLVFVALLEWPLLLSRGRFDLLALPVLLRTGLLILAAVELARGLRRRSPSTGGGE